MRIKASGRRGMDNMTLSIRKKYRKYIPDYFIIELDSADFKPRKKGERKQ